MTEVTAPVSSCPCGSDLCYVECCGRTAASEGATRDEPPRVGLLYMDAQRAAGEARRVHALTAVREILNQVPLHYGAIRMVLAIPNPLQVFDAEALQDIAARGLAAYPDDLDLQCDAAGAYQAVGQPDRSEQLLRAVLDEQPHHLRAHIGLGQLARRRHQLDMAEYHYRQAYYNQQYAPRVLNELAAVLSAMGRKHEAEHYFRIALAQAPDEPAVLMNWCRMEESRGDLNQAWRLLEMARESSREATGIRITEAMLHRREKNNPQSLTVLDEIDPEQLDPPGKVSLGMERCATLDKMGRYDEAFEAAVLANGVKQNDLGFHYDAEKQSEVTGTLKEYFTLERFKLLEKGRPVSDNEEQPIFICGFTRSGTSMVEQILSAHSRICGGDELPFIYDLARNAGQLLGSEKPFPDCLFEPHDAKQPAPLQMLRQRYLGRLRLTAILEPGVRKFTDKMPMNELHLALIHGMFPEARIIHVVRHPLDSVLSTFFTDATHGGYCSYDLASTAQHYRMLMEMTEYYRSTLGIEVLRVRYEDIVGDIRQQTGRMLDFLGEPLEDACLDFHLNPRYSRTASYAQVTQKLYDSSMYRHRNYQAHLQPAIDELGPVIEMLGYEA